MSMKGKGGRQRGYSVVEERDVTVAKALMFVIKRAIQKEDVEEGDDGEYLVADLEGWTSVADVVCVLSHTQSHPQSRTRTLTVGLSQLAHSRISALGATLEDIQRLVATAIKSRFDLRQMPNSESKSEDPTSWQISRITNKESIASPVLIGDKLTAETPDLPEFVIYETSYQRYPLLVALGAITRAPGGSEYRTFVPVAVDEAGNESRQTPGSGEAAEVSVWIHLRTAMQAEPSITWQRSDSGTIITADDVPKGLWKKAVARRPEIGLLFENGEVRKEVPANLRGKGAKGKARKRKGTVKQEGSGDDSGSASEE
jgi:hypothetical protein